MTNFKINLKLKTAISSLKLNRSKCQKKTKGRYPMEKKGKEQKELEKFEEKLKKLYLDLVTKADIPILLCAFLEIEKPSLRGPILKALLIREKITFDGLDDILPVVKNLLEKLRDSSLEETFWQKYLRMASPDNLYYLGIYEDQVLVEKILQEIERRVKVKILRADSARKILREIFEKQPDANSRKKIWEPLKKLKPSQEELEKLLSFVTQLGSLPEIEAEIARLLGEYRKKWFFRSKKGIPRSVRKIKDILKKIEELEKGQS